MRIRKWMTLVVAFAMAFTVIGFGLATDEVSAATKTSKITALTPSKATIDVKGKVTVSVKSVYPANASKSVTWKSSNTKIATVSSKGVVTGKKTGKVKITAISKSNKNAKKSITITVKNLKPTSISLPSSITVYTGVNSTVKATVPAKYYNAGVVYKLSNTTYATILPSGKATKGSVTIKPNSTSKTSIKTYKTVTLTAYSKESSKIKKTCKIKVVKSIPKLTFATASKELEINGGTYTQTADIVGTSGTKGIKYTSSKPEVAYVNPTTGEVTPKSLGTATITAKAKYGYPTKATYKVTVYENLKPEISDDEKDATYHLYKSKYDRYVVSATRNDMSGTISLDYGDIDNILGFGNCGFDWTNAKSVRTHFADAEFNYVSGDNYVFSKTGNKIRTTFGGRTAIWYYEDDSYSEVWDDVKEDYNYTITLWDKNHGESLVISKTGKTVDVTTSLSDDYGFTMVMKGDNYSITVRSGDRMAAATFVSVNENEYTITFDNNDRKQQDVQVKAYKN